MVKKKNVIGMIILILMISSCFIGSERSLGFRIEPPIEPPIKPPPPPPPPPTTTISGYVKESGTSIGLYNARVVLFGWEFVIDMYQFVQVGVRYTSTSGFYSFADVTADSPYSLVVTKSGYSGYSGAYRNPVYLTKLDSTIRITGNVVEDDTIDNIQSPNVNPLTLDITPDGAGSYNHVISSATTKVTVYDYTGAAIKTVLCSSTTGDYDTGSFSIKNGNIRITAYTQPGIFTSKSLYRSVSTSTTFTGQNFALEKNLGMVSAYSDEQIREEMMNFYLQINENYQPLEEVKINLESRCTPQLTYDPLYSGAKYNFLETSYDLTTFEFWSSLLDHNYYTPRYVNQYLYVTNHWTGDESIISLDDLDSGITQTGSFSKYQWTLGTKVGFSGTDSLPFQAEFSVSATYSPPDFIDILQSPINEDQANERYLGQVSVDYTNAAMTRNSKMSNVWHLKMDNSLMKSAKQCGSHFTFRIVTDINYWLCKDVFGNNWWNKDYCTIRFQQILGDGDPTGIGDNSPPPHPIVTLLSGAYDDIQDGTMVGYDLWMNLLAGEIDPPPI